MSKTWFWVLGALAVAALLWWRKTSGTISTIPEEISVKRNAVKDALGDPTGNVAPPYSGMGPKSNWAGSGIVQRNQAPNQAPSNGQPPFDTTRPISWGL